jgi:hypothetical protein
MKYYFETLRWTGGHVDVPELCNYFKKKSRQTSFWKNALTGEWVFAGVDGVHFAYDIIKLFLAFLCSSFSFKCLSGARFSRWLCVLFRNKSHRDFCM